MEDHYKKKRMRTLESASSLLSVGLEGKLVPTQVGILFEKHHLLRDAVNTSI